MQWCIYYGDGSTFSDLDGAPQEAPGLNVQIVVQDDPSEGHNDVGHVYHHGEFAYWWEHDQWFSGDQVGLFDYLQRARGKETKVIFGRSITFEDFERIRLDAMQTNIRPKTAWKKGEQWPKPKVGQPL